MADAAGQLEAVTNVASSAAKEKDVTGVWLLL
jgi:hypothetical protein